MGKTEKAEDVKDGEDTNDKTEEHPVFEAIKDSKDDVELIRNFFEIDGIPVEKQDTSGMTVLMHACWKGYENIVKFLIKQVGCPQSFSNIIILIWKYSTELC